jgi:PQQ-like domain
MYGHDTARTNYNKGDTMIGPEHVTQLAPRFRTLIGAGDLPSASGPVVAGGRVYVGSSVSTGPNYFCLDAGTGAVLWSTEIGHASFPGNVGIGSTAAVVDGGVYVGGGDAAFYALDAQTGAVRWRHPMDDAPDAFAWSSPLVSNGVVYVGMSAEYKSLRSELRALDAATGALKANQFLVPEGEIGGDLWNSQALSPDGSTVLAASGNDFDFDSPYARAIIAFDAVTLALQAWHQEAVPNEDLDFGTTPVVFHDASGRHLVGANSKNGRFYAYDLTSEPRAWPSARCPPTTRTPDRGERSSSWVITASCSGSIPPPGSTAGHPWRSGSATATSRWRTVSSTRGAGTDSCPSWPRTRER